MKVKLLIFTLGYFSKTKIEPVIVYQKFEYMSKTPGSVPNQDIIRLPT